MQVPSLQTEHLYRSIFFSNSRMVSDIVAVGTYSGDMVKFMSF